VKMQDEVPGGALQGREELAQVRARRLAELPLDQIQQVGARLPFPPGLTAHRTSLRCCWILAQSTLAVTARSDQAGIERSKG
jgi:hypothetical protein